MMLVIAALIEIIEGVLFGRTKPGGRSDADPGDQAEFIDRQRCAR